MADDIQISGLNDQSGAKNAQQAGQTQQTLQSGQSGANPVVGGQGSTQVGAAQPTTNDGQLNPVIDLRNSGNGATGSTVISAAQQQGVSTPVASVNTQANPPSIRRANAILLGDDDGTSSSVQEKYAIPALVKEKFPDLIQLIKETESMNDEERDYWFQILPIMTEDQIKKFRDILVNEKQQLASLDTEYEQELQKLNDKHMIEWKEFETKEKRKTLTSAEQASKDQEKSEEEDLLKRLSQV